VAWKIAGPGCFVTTRREAAPDRSKRLARCARRPTCDDKPHLVRAVGRERIAAGFLAGLFGVGGGLVMVPVLVYAFSAAGVPAEHIVALALGTSMAAIVVSAMQSAYGHYRRGSASTIAFQAGSALGDRRRSGR